MTAAALNTSRSDALFTAAQQLMPGGVNSPVRAFRSVGGQPIVFDRVEGAYAWDVDGNRYIDYSGWGPPSAVTPTRGDRGPATLTRAPAAPRRHLADGDRRRPQRGMVRFVNSGTEACMAVLRLMRAYTGREVIKFEGCLRSMFLVGPAGVAALGLPDSPGVPSSTTANTLTHNDRGG